MSAAGGEELFPGFALRDLDSPRGRIRARIGGEGPPLLLLHGFPETHLMWHATAAPLADRFTVIAADLPGYGDSFRPVPSTDHSAHGKRALAEDLVAAMAALGHDRFAVVGHDRGGRVAYRMALDHPDRVIRLAVLDIVPTGEVWARADDRFALVYWHWGFLAQPAPLPERLLAADPGVLVLAAERMGIRRGDRRYPDAVLDDLARRARDPEAIEAMCEDYRAGATVDRALDEADTVAGRTVACPMLVLWGASGALPFMYDGDPLAAWRTLAPDAEGRAIDGAGHFIPEDAPEATVTALTGFLDSPPAAS